MEEGSLVSWPGREGVEDEGPWMARGRGRRRNGGIGGVEVDCGPGWRPEKYVSC